MIPVEEALQLILDHTGNYGSEKIDLLQSGGRILAGAVTADRDFPPYNRVKMDGFAIQYESFEKGRRTYSTQGVQAAGSIQARLERAENCIEVMTGAVLPEDADAVIPYEECDVASGKVTIQSDKIARLQNVHVKGEDGRENDLLLSEGQKITPAMIGVMATVGLSRIPVYRLPSIAVCSTGDELIDINRQPLPHQIRRSNSYMLAAELVSENIKADIGHLRDDKDAMKQELDAILKNHDVVLFSGAVSRGKYDYLPEVLTELGMTTVFHRVAQKPGKPFMFGKFKDGTLIFGFPGNPVSTYICYHYYFKAWLFNTIHYQTGHEQARLSQEVRFGLPLSYHLPVTLQKSEGVIYATPVRESGSGDLLSLTRADGFITLPMKRSHYDKDELFDVTTFS